MTNREIRQLGPTYRSASATETPQEHPHTDRRGLLRALVGITAAAVGAGAVLESQSGAAHASAGLYSTADGSGNTRVQGNGTNGADGVYGQSDSAAGVQGSSSSGTGVYASSTSGYGVQASSGSDAVYASSTGANGIYAQSSAAGAFNAVAATGTNGTAGVTASSDSDTGVAASSTSGTGVSATSTSGTGVSGTSSSGAEVDGCGTSGTGVGVRARAGQANKPALEVRGLLTLKASDAGGNSPVGQVTIAAGSSSQTVVTGAVTVSSTILLTPLGNPGAYLWIKARTAGSFTIGASKALSIATVVQYLIIN